jgi:hypothetical protein
VSRPAQAISPDQDRSLTAAEVARALARARARIELAPNITDWRGLKASDRARPLTDLGRRLLGLHLTTTTPKEN